MKTTAKQNEMKNSQTARQMNELKAITVYDAYWKANSVGDGTGIFVYPKSEVDKVIALLKDKANYNEYAYKIKSEELADTCRFYEDELQHHKYKRCLAMAMWCHNQREIYERDSYNWELEDEAVNSLRNKASIMKKWHKRWLKLAEKFKEAK